MKKQRIAPIVWTSEKDAENKGLPNFERTRSTSSRPPSYRTGVMAKNMIMENI